MYEIESIDKSAVTEIRTRRGALAGHKIAFGSDGLDLRAIKDRLVRDSGLTKSAATKRVNALLRGGEESRLREIQASALVSALHADGYVPALAERRNKSAVIRWTVPSEPKAGKVGKAGDKAAALAKENEGLKKRLAALEAMLPQAGQPAIEA